MGKEETDDRERKNERLSLRIAGDLKQRIVSAAKKKERDPSDWLRRVIEEACRKAGV